MFSLFDLIQDRPPLINIVDVGAMSLGAGTDPFEALVKHGATRIVGFEPVPSECEKLNRLHDGRRRYLPYAVGDGTARTFHTCRSVATSSLYEPYTELLDKFQNLENLVHVVDRTAVQTHRLDDIAEVADTDYLKVDVQGAELDVFRGAERVLRHVLVVQTEVEFVPLYRDQPLFSDVDQLLRRSGFLFHRFDGIASRVFKPLVNNNNVNAPGSQLLWADAVYIRNFMQLDRLAPEQLLKLAIILHELYGSFDACALVLQAHAQKADDRLLQSYYRQLLGKPGSA